MEMVYEVMDYAKNQDWGQILWWSKGGIITIAATIYLVSCLRKLGKKKPGIAARDELYLRLFNLIKEGVWTKHGLNSIRREFDSVQSAGDGKDAVSKKSSCTVNYGKDWDISVDGNSVNSILTASQRNKLCRMGKRQGRFLDEQYNALQTAVIAAKLPGTTSV